MADPIIPLGTYIDVDGTPVFRLRPADFQRINEGYGCPFCLQPFDFWVANCPACGNPNVIDARPDKRKQTVGG